MYGAGLARDVEGPGPGPLQDRVREEVQRNPKRPGEAQGAGHYTQNSSTGTLNSDVLGPTQVGASSARVHGLGLVTNIMDGLDFHEMTLRHFRYST